MTRFCILGVRDWRREMVSFGGRAVMSGTVARPLVFGEVAEGEIEWKSVCKIIEAIKRR